MVNPLNLNLQNITLGQINVFLRVVEQESFTRAALELHLTQSAVSKIIAKLERELDMKLFHRLYRELQVTEEGRMLYSYWQPGLMRLSDSYELLHQEKNGKEEHLQIGVTNSTNLNAYFWEIINAFQNQHDTIRLEFNSDSMDSLIRKLSGQQLDVIFVPDFMKYRLENAGFSWMWAAKDYVQIVLPNDHDLAKREGSLTFEDIKDMTFVTLSDSDYPEYVRQIREMFEEAGYTWQEKKVSFRTPESIQDFYRSEDGFMITDRYFKLNEETRPLVRKSLEGFYNGIICAWDPSDQKDKKELFLESLKNRAV